MFKILPEPMYYDWGNSRLVNEFFGSQIEPPLTLAELWMGTHPRGPSRLALPGPTPGFGRALSTGQNLRDLVAAFPGDSLGHASTVWGGELPFLLKILSAGKALSIQVHPSKEQAAAGFDREDRAGIPLGAPYRNYKDRNHKPECILALSEFWALSGFREPEQVLDLLAPVRDAISQAYSELGQSGRPAAQRLEGFLKRLLNTPPDLMADAFSRLLEHARASQDEGADPHRWFLVLNSQFPGDPGCLAAYYLNILRLEPGQVLVMKSGLLHAYLAGIGVELMANSDNVLRAGCTSKHVDVAELAAITEFAPGMPDLRVSALGQWFDSGFPEFRFLRGTGADGDSLNSPAEGNPRIVLCISGRLTLEYVDQGAERAAGLETTPGWAKKVALDRGQAVFIPAAAGKITMNHQVVDGAACTWFCAAPGKV